MPERVAFSKPALPLDQQIAVLESRGLAVPDHDLARRALANISYYRLSGYTRYFTEHGDGQKFREGVSFDDVVALYAFDRRLRVLMSDAFERIEIAVKGALSYHGATLVGPFWMTDPANFDHGTHGQVADLIKDACAPGSEGKHKQVFLEAYFKKYSDPVPPAWMITEVLSFHGASIIYKFARGNIRVPIATQFAVQHGILQSWLHALVFARNVCAHHMRLWNRVFTIKPMIPKGYRNDWPEAAQGRLYITCCIVHHMLQQLGGDPTWHIRLRDLIRDRPGVPLHSMGFPDDWEGRSNWAFEPPADQALNVAILVD